MFNEFEPSVAGVAQCEAVSAELRPLLLEVFGLLRQRAEPTEVADAIEKFLRFLRSPSGRSNANCAAIDHFFALVDDWGEVSWDYLPVSLGDVLAYAGGALGDAVSASEVAENFFGTPELLLARLRASRQGPHVLWPVARADALGGSGPLRGLPMVAHRYALDPLVGLR